MTISVDIPSDGWSDLNSDPEALRRVPRHFALDHDVLALAWDGDELAVAIPEAAAPETIDRIRFETGARVRAVVAPRDIIRTRLSRAYPSLSTPFRNEREDESPVVSILDAIIEDALEHTASDIHMEPSKTGGRVRERVHGAMRAGRTIPDDQFDRVVARVKLLAGMDVADRRQPQDGRFTIEIAGRTVDARVATLPTPDGEKAVVRLLRASELPSGLDGLGMSSDVLAAHRSIIRSAHGCVIVAGPTGSGKTTTLYASLADRNGAELNICSVEDPVEMRLSDVTQVQICQRAGVTFASALRSIVRQDPDLVMIGEVRDAETAHAAIGAALAGHLVLTSIHAGEGEGALERLVEFGVSRRSIASCVRGVLSQRLVRRTPRAGVYGARTGVFELATVDRTGHARVDEGGSLAHRVEGMIARGETDRAEARRILGEMSA